MRSLSNRSIRLQRSDPGSGSIPWLIAGYVALLLLALGVLSGSLNVGGMVTSAGVLLGGYVALGWPGVLAGALAINATTAGAVAWAWCNGGASRVS